MTGTELAQRETRLTTLTAEQVDLVKRTIAPDATDDELALFIQQCNRTGLDPFAKQIYSIKRKAKDEAGNWIETRQTQIAIDGARLIAERVNQRRPGAYRPGPTEWLEARAEFGGPQWVDAWVVDVPPAAARATVYKDGEPVVAIAAYNEFVQRNRDGGPTRQWKAMPAHMLAKCAEMLALRRAFPQELSGLIIDEEPPLAGPRPMTTRVSEALATDEQLAALADEFAKLLSGGDVEQDALDARLLERYGTAKLAELTRPQADELLERLKEGSS